MATQESTPEQAKPLRKKKVTSSESSKPSLTLEQLQKQLSLVLSEIAEASGNPLPNGALDPQMPLEMLGEEDVMLRVDIRAYTKNGEAFRVSGISTAPHILSDHMHLEAPRNFEELYHSTVTRPALNRFNALIGQYTKKRKDDREEGTRFLPARGASEDQGYISDTE